MSTSEASQFDQPDSPSSSDQEDQELSGLKDSPFLTFSKGIVRMLLNRPAGFLGLLAIVLGGLVLPVTGATAESICGLERSAGVPCPSCGLTRSVTCVYQGEFLAALQYHPLGYFFAFIFLMMAPSLFYPNSMRNQILNKLTPHARIFGWVFITMIVFMFAYGINRGIKILSNDPAYEWWIEKQPAPALQESHNHSSEEITTQLGNK